MTDLNSLVRETMSAYHEHEAEKKRKAAEKKRQQEQESEHALRQLLGEHLLPEFLTEIGEFSFRHDYSTYYGNITHTVYAFFPYENLHWYLSHSQGNWFISTTGKDTRSGYQKTQASGVNSADLQAHLLFVMGKHHEEVEEERQKEEDYQARREQEKKERREMEAREEASRKARITEADQEHERLLALFKEAWAKAEREMWYWPEGTTIEIYQVEYAKGGYRDEEDGETRFEYGSGWTATDHLDGRGRIQLEPTRSYPSSTRMIQLVMDIHRPIWTVHQYSSVEELPEILREKVTVSLPGVVKRYNHSLDGEPRLVEVESLGYDEEEHEKTIGEVPLPWIRAIVESVANGE